MKFWLILMLLTTLCFGQDQNQEEEKRRFKKEAEEIYSSSDIEAIVSFPVFYKAYVAYFKYRQKLNGAPLISFLNYSIPNSQDRFVTIDIQKRRKVLISKASHGINSSQSQGGGACQRNSSRRGIPACPYSFGVPAVAFSNVIESLQSSLGLMIAAEQNMSQIVNENLKLKGLEVDLNSLLFNRGVVLHTSGAWGGISEGCIVLPQKEFWVAYELLKNNTLILTFESNQMRSESGGASESEVAQAVDAKKNNSFTAAPDVANARALAREFSQTSISQAKPSLGMSAMGTGQLNMSGLNLLGTNNPDSNLLPAPIPPSVAGVETLNGTNKYKECQMLSDSSWSETVRHINSGGKPADRFRGSWQEFQTYVSENAIDPGPAMALAQERVAAINDCVAIAHVSTRTDYTKPNINAPEKKSSADGSITCVYNNPESQDYQACLKTIAAHDALMQAEADAHKKQKEDFKSKSQSRVNQIQGVNAQSAALDQSSAMIKDHSDVAFERAEISRAKIQQLSAVAATIPTLDSLYDECTEKFAKHGTVALEDFNEIASVYSTTTKFNFKANRDYCLVAVSKSVNPTQNQKAREEVKNVLKKFGVEMQDYVSKSKDLLQQTTQTPSLLDTKSGFDIDLDQLGLSSTLSKIENDQVKSNRFDYNSPPEAQGIRTTNSASAEVNEDLALTMAKRRGKGFAGSDFDLSDNNRVATRGGDEIKNGIYNDEFYRKINLALKNPDQLENLKLSPEQMKEYLNQKAYFDSISSKSRDRRDDFNNAKAGKSQVLEFGEENSPNINSKELDLFEIISSRYKKSFFNKR